MNVNQVAFATTTFYTVLTGTTYYAATAVTSSLASACFAFLAASFAIGAALSLAAWTHSDSTTPETFFSRFAWSTFKGPCQYIAQFVRRFDRV